MVAVAGPAESIDVLSYDDWLSGFRRAWRQGEHVALLGQTGSGKTYVSRDILSARDYVVVLALKRRDDTIRLFTSGTPKYKRVKKWPLDWGVHRAVVELTPESLADASQAMRVYGVLNDVFRDGNWAVFIDDTGYATGTLRLKRQITVLLNQGRSQGISVVTAATQPTSIAANIPSETLRQVRHVIMWRFETAQDIEACAKITGIDKRSLAAYMQELGVYGDASTDFLSYRRGYGMVLVRQRRRHGG